MIEDSAASAPRPRLIERWFPCAEVSAASATGWGSSNSETLIMSWFAKRPLAQARAAMLCSLLPWPADESEQARVQAVVREALGSCQDPDYFRCRASDCLDPDCTKRRHFLPRSTAHAHGIQDCVRMDESSGYNAARRDVLDLLASAYPGRAAKTIDPFAGRGLIPLEASRLGIDAWAVDYSPVATMASRLLVEYPFRRWSNEPALAVGASASQGAFEDLSDDDRLSADINILSSEVQQRLDAELDSYYPLSSNGRRPWGYLWAVEIDCDECGRPFPLVSSTTLRTANPKRKLAAQSLEVRGGVNGYEVAVVDGETTASPTMRPMGGGRTRGKLAWCPFEDCQHAHGLPEHKAKVHKGYDRVVLLAVGEIDGSTKCFREPSTADIEAAARAAETVRSLTVNGLPASPKELLVQGSSRMMAVHYGARTFGDLSVPRQNLFNATLCRIIADIADEIRSNGGSADYSAALVSYLGASFARKLKYSTRGAWLRPRAGGQVEVAGIFINESSLGFNYDFFEVGIGEGPGSWKTVAGAPAALSNLCRTKGSPASVSRGSALGLPQQEGSMDAVVTDPPYDAMINYSDASDLWFVWLRRALGNIFPEFAMTSNPLGTQENAEEIIVSHYWDYSNVEGEHRTPEHYDSLIAAAFRECRRVVHEDGVVTIVFGHGEPEVWRRILDAITSAGLMLTGAWPANTEKGGSAGSANINTTLTLACRRAPAGRPSGRVAEVDAEMRRVVAQRVRDVWEPSGLTYVDQKMAAAGPALEVVGKYAQILDKKGQPVDLDRYLPLARQAVTEAHDLRFDSLPLETFDQKTRFALEWARAYGRRVQAKSEARWQRLAAELDEAETVGVLTDVEKGVRLLLASEAHVEPMVGLSLFEVALAAARQWKSGTLRDAAVAVNLSGVPAEDQHFWAVLNALSKALPETDPDGAAWTAMVRNRDALAVVIATGVSADTTVERPHEERPGLFDADEYDPNSLFGREGRD